MDESAMAKRRELLDESLGCVVIDAITSGSLVRVSYAQDAKDSERHIDAPDVVFVWSATAAEQIGQTVLGFLGKLGYLGKHVRRGVPEAGPAADEGDGSA